MVVMRHMRRWGHLGLIFTQGLPWTLAAIAIHPTALVALAYIGLYLGLRVAMTWSIGIRGLRERGLWQRMFLIPLWDAFACFIWLASFFRKTVRWRDSEYWIRDGMLLAVTSSPAEK